MLILYELALSPFVQKVKIGLREKGVDFEARDCFDPVDKADFEQGNPRREVPLLIDGDTRISDSTIILDYADERWPDHPLLPKNPADRAEVRLIEEMADTRLEALNYCIAEVMSIPVGADEAVEQVVANSKAEIAHLHDELSVRLGEGPFFGGTEPNRADISLIPIINASRAMKNGPTSGALADWLDRMVSRPSVSDTISEVKAGMGVFRDLMARVKSGAEKRQIRDHRLDWLIQAGGIDILNKRLEAGNVRFSTE